MTGTGLACPYCAGELSPAVLACQHCGRMVGHLLPMLARQTALSAELATLRAELAELRALSVRPVTAPAASPALAGVPARTNRSTAATLVAAVLLVAVTSALLHWLLLFVYDAPPMLLRILTLGVPMVLGVRASRIGGASLVTHALASVCCGLAAVAAMFTVTHLIDGVPLLPQDAREAREALEYSISIALAFLTGFLLTHSLSQASRRPVTDTAPGNGPGALIGYAQRFQQLAGLLSPICAGGLALYSGLKSLAG
ncbi:MAG: hypothetical protein ACK5T2_01790 [bacterium]